MLVFNFNLTTHNAQYHNDKTFNVLEYEGDFEITVNSAKFFSEPYFSILEFLRDALNWVQRKSPEMIYNCIDTEDNPLIHFTENEGLWFVKSPWQKFECNLAFTREELETAVIKLKSSVEDQIRKFQL